MMMKVIHSFEETILFQLVANKAQETHIKTLIFQMKDISIKDSNGNNILHCSIIHSNFKIVPTIISSGIKITEPSQYGYTALHFAAQKKICKFQQIQI